MNKKRKFRRKIGTIALLQIIILIASIIAFSYLVGESLLVVSADPDGPGDANKDKNFDRALSYVPVPAGAMILKDKISSLSGGISEATGVEATTAPSAGIFPSIGSILENAGYAAGIYVIINFGLQLVGVDPSLANALGASAAGGYFIGYLAEKFGPLIGAQISTLAALGIGLGVAIILFLLFSSNSKQTVVQFNCQLWDAPSGGSNCEKCNDGILPCTEYRCASLGQGCELINKGTDNELCIWNNRDDIKPPVIKAWLQPLTTGYKYIPDNAISPPNAGVKIVPENNVKGCVAPFKPLSFGITLDEVAKCKISQKRASSFEEMEDIMFSGGLKFYNHSFTLNPISKESLEAAGVTIPTGGETLLYVRCEDENGNSNTAEFIFNFCVDERDTNEPQIMSTSIINGMPISFNRESVDLSVYVNEPAECRWSKDTDLGYDDMTNEMDCETSVLQMNAQGLYECKTTLTGLNDRVDNIFFFKCKDQPWAEESDRYVNQQSYKFVLKGTEPLYILSAEPNKTTIRDSTNVIKVTLKVETSAGYNKGQALCSYEGYRTNGNFNEFYTTNSYKHSQDLYLPEGDYTYNIKCVDLGGNADNTVVTFNVETDTQPPIVVRVYHDEQNLKIITNENATCVYSTESMKCGYSFDDGIEMETSSNSRIHSTKWDKSKTFYIKCQDDFGNRVLTDQCNIIAKPFEVA